jgi:hypothetical protein
MQRRCAAAENMEAYRGSLVDRDRHEPRFARFVSLAK